jgi:hypothetical protein
MERMAVRANRQRVAMGRPCAQWTKGRTGQGSMFPKPKHTCGSMELATQTGGCQEIKYSRWSNVWLRSSSQAFAFRIAAWSMTRLASHFCIAARPMTRLSVIGGGISNGRPEAQCGHEVITFVQVAKQPIQTKFQETRLGGTEVCRKSSQPTRLGKNATYSISTHGDSSSSVFRAIGWG